jgi:hypothetical protein
MKAHVYSGPHYGRLHEILAYNRFSRLVTVRYRGDTFAVPRIDVETPECPQCGGPLNESRTHCPHCFTVDADEARNCSKEPHASPVAKSKAQLP